MLRAMLSCLAAFTVAFATPALAEPKPKGGRPPKKVVVSPEKAEFNTTRANFLYAARSCERPGRCDQELLKDAETRFAAACGACTDKGTCEAEVRAIKSGGGTKGFEPCK